ncbi:diguanylate cyclase [Chitinivorax sp. PXF-14]|uniref:sensor domain-containing diguanylate cyclase n=1 Tax=Chitinivorax sp. PXF-14 TaxID=3230488 RepID=UPI003465E3B4
MFASLLPGMIGVAFLFVREYQRGAANAERETITTARALSQVVDSRLTQAQTVAQVLATAGALRRGDFERFDERAREILALTKAGANVVLADATGQQVFNTLRPIGAALPQHGNPKQLKQVFETGQAVVSDLYLGGVLRKSIISVDVPVIIDGQVKYDLSMGVMPGTFSQILAAQSFAPDKIVAILDSQGAIVARTHGQGRFVGQKAVQPVLDRMRVSPEGSIDVPTREGIPSEISWSRSRTTGWGVAIATPHATTRRELMAPIATLLAGMIAMLALGLALAWTLSRSIADSLHALLEPAARLGNAELAPIPPVAICEAAEVAVAINHASILLTRRTNALLEANEKLQAQGAELKEAHYLARFGHWRWRQDSPELLVSESSEEIFGRKIPRLLKDCLSLLSHDARVQLLEAVAETLRTGQSFSLELPAIHADGHTIWLDMKCEAIRNDAGEIVELLGTAMDVTARKQAELELMALNKSYRTHLEQQVAQRTAELSTANEELAKLARTDALTGIHNRIAAQERLKAERLRMKRSGTAYSVLFLDIDHFKNVNDTYGHEIGDLVLKHFAHLVQSSIREVDFLARFGGEEFLALLPDTGLEGALTMAEKIRQIIANAPFPGVGSITVSIGVAVAGHADDKEDDVVNRADAALYRAKSGGRNVVRA